MKQKAYSLLMGFLFFVAQNCLSQNQKIADSLKNIYEHNILADTSKLEILRNIAFNELKDLHIALHYAEELIALSKKLGNNLYLHRGYIQKGNKKRLLGDLDEALEAYFKSVEAARAADYIRGEGSTYNTIADIYSVSNNHQNAMLYYHKAIATLRKSKDSIALASSISNAGDEFLNYGNYDSALLYFRESMSIFEKVNYQIGKAYSLGNMGMVYANIGQSGLAEKNINEATRLLEEAEDYYPICVYLISMCDIYIAKGDNKTAHNYALKSLNLAKQYGLKEQISNANLKLSILYEKAGKPAESFKYYKDHITYRDSVNDIKSVQNMADLRTDYEVSQKQVEVDLLNQQRKNQRIILYSLFIILGLGIILLGTLYWYYRTISREKKRSENLLLNILPAETAKELKLNGKVEAVKFDEVTVLFTDFVAFSKYAEHTDPEQLVKSIDFYFKEFDEITTRHGLEKIKTIGDSYMCACGLPTPNPAHARNVIMAAREMISLVKSVLYASDGLSHFDVRIGIHTGPVVAGIVGIKKFQYDIWGDTVNIASRMESKSEPGRINISETTYHQIKDEFICEYRGEIEVKNRGNLKMYFLS
ncbi:MAG TPA: adenylate/guanylate cyclase domain-containing protein [Chitinophagaceae bacterium]|nr:adenylate/guanylate cyclase domain-containing protein [Chitinophagaceae bacterium]